ncbi:MAG: hypothetical protein K2L15_00475 [Eubacteriales bacterium]|nr:hypothetical protein [Eubacteriales bacterium]
MKRFLTTFFALTLFSTVGVLGGSSSEFNKKKDPLGDILTINGVPLNNINWSIDEDKKPDNNTTTQKPNNTVTTQKPNNTVTTQKPNNTVTTQKPNNTVTTQKPNNTVTTQKPNNTTTTQKPNNTITTEKPTETTTQSTEKPGNSNSSLSAIEKEVVRLVNVERNKAGLPALQIDESVSKVARLKSEDMANKNYFDHTSPTYGSPFEMLKSFNITYKSAGENIAKGQKTAEAVVNAWMNSEGHKKNILSKSFTHIGVGYAKRGNTPYWTQMFIKK